MSPRSSRAVQNRQTTERVKSAILHSESATAPPTTTFGSHRRMHAVVRGGVLRALATLKPPKPQPNAREQRVVPLGHLAVACHGKPRQILAQTVTYSHEGFANRRFERGFEGGLV